MGKSQVFLITTACVYHNWTVFIIIIYDGLFTMLQKNYIIQQN